MQAGNYNRRIAIESYTTSKDAYGENQKTWVLFREAFAAVQTASSREVFQSDKLTQIDTVLFHVRYIEGIDSKMRIIHEGQAYNIRQVLPKGRRKELQIVAEYAD